MATKMTALDDAAVGAADIDGAAVRAADVDAPVGAVDVDGVAVADVGPVVRSVADVGGDTAIRLRLPH
jgi:hypothetical protein